MDFEQLFRNGTQLLHQGKVAEALPLLEEAHKLNPDHMDAALNLSGAYILSKKFRKAAAILEPLSEQYPDEAMIWTNLGAAYLGNPVLARDKEQRQAIAAFEKALAAHSVAPNVAYNIGLIYRDRQEVDKAISWFKKAIQANPNDRDARNLLRSLESDEI
jgi:tetratricopeptide (TPR) repeat protein